MNNLNAFHALLLHACNLLLELHVVVTINIQTLTFLSLKDGEGDDILPPALLTDISVLCLAAEALTVPHLTTDLNGWLSSGAPAVVVVVVARLTHPVTVP